MRRKITTLKLAARIYPKVVNYRLFGKPAPLLVSFGITNRCNLKCNYCFAGLKERAGKELPTEKLLDYIGQFIDLGAGQIDLQGGEPTLHPDLGALISRIVDGGAHCTIATNGFSVDKYLKDLKKCYRVCISIDGLAETTDFHRGKGAYESAVRALDTMIHAGVNVRMHGVLTYATKRADVEHLIELARKYNTNVNFVYALDSGNNRTGCDQETNFPQHIKDLSSFILGLKKEHAPIVSKASAIRQVINWPYGSQDILFEQDLTKEQKDSLKGSFVPRCLWGHLACFFNPDGRLYLCPRAYDREGFFVQIGNKTIREAFYELARSKRCYSCGQMGDLTHSFCLSYDNIKTWFNF